MAKGELSTSSIKIDRLRNKILEGEIKIPPFQRAFVWKQEQVIDLLDSIYNDFPIGSVLLWETSEDLPSSRNIGGFVLPDSRAEYPINYILDGQQRVTSIFGVFCQGLPQEHTDFDAPLDLFNIYFDLDEKKFVHETKRNSEHTNLQLRLLFNNYDFNLEISNTNKYTREKNMLAVELQSLFQNYELPVVTIKKREKTEVGIIFERINNTGTPLTTLDLMIAWTWKEDYHLKEVFDDIFDLLERKSFGDIKQKIVLQCFSGIIKETTVTSEILKLDPNDVRENTEKLKESLEKAIDFIHTQFNVMSDDFLPKSHQIVPLTFLFSHTNRLSEEQSKAVQKWFWRTSFSNRYSSATDDAMDEDIAFFKKILNNDTSDISKYQTSITGKYIKSQTLTKSNPFVRAILLLFAQFRPLDLTNGNNIDLGEALSSYNKKEYHHVFPKAYLKNVQGLSNEKINVLGNFCFLPASSNKLISDKQPSDYFFSLIPDAQYENILKTNLMPTDVEIYRKNEFDEFVNKRVERIEEAIKALAGE